MNDESSQKIARQNKMKQPTDALLCLPMHPAAAAVITPPPPPLPPCRPAAACAARVPLLRPLPL